MWTVKERMALPVWDGDRVTEEKRDFFPGDSITAQDFKDARQDEDERAMLIKHNCYTKEELAEIQEQQEQAEKASASVSNADEALPTQEER